MTAANRKKEKALDWDYLYEILDYDEDTGIFRWKVRRNGANGIGSIAGCTRKDGYIILRIGGINYYAHRLAWYYVWASWPSKFIDHMDGHKDNNTISNLRECTQQENMQNTKKPRSDNTSGSSIPGVSFHKASGKYAVCLCINGKNKHFGLFATLEEAEQVALEQRRIHYRGNTL